MQLKCPIGQTFGFALIFLALFVSSCELMARSQFIQSELPKPIIGAGHKNFDLKIAHLDEFVKKRGSIDCIFLGASNVYKGIDPDAFRMSFKKSTGKEIRCFNFGIGGLNLPTALVLIKILNRLYCPKLFVLGLLPSKEGQGLEAEKKLLENPWIKYHRGVSSLDGWLMEHFFAYRYYIRFRTWMEQPSVYRKICRHESKISVHGFSPATRVMGGIAIPPAPEKEPRLFNKWADFEISSRHMAAFKEITRLSFKKSIIILEMPLHPTFFTFFPNGSKDYHEIIAAAREQTGSQDVLFWSTTQLRLIPDDGWADRQHMNKTGARLFGRWLGEKIGHAVNRGLIQAPVS